MQNEDLDKLITSLGQCRNLARRTGSKVLVHIIEMALLEMVNVAVSTGQTKKPARHEAERAKSREVQA